MEQAKKASFGGGRGGGDDGTLSRHDVLRSLEELGVYVDGWEADALLDRFTVEDGGGNVRSRFTLHLCMKRPNSMHHLQRNPCDICRTTEDAHVEILLGSILGLKKGCSTEHALPSLYLNLVLVLYFPVGHIPSGSLQVDWVAFVSFMQAAENKDDGDNNKNSSNTPSNGTKSAARATRERAGLRTSLPRHSQHRQRHWATSAPPRGGGLFEGEGNNHADWHLTNYSSVYNL